MVGWELRNGWETAQTWLGDGKVRAVVMVLVVPDANGRGRDVESDSLENNLGIRWGLRRLHIRWCDGFGFDIYIYMPDTADTFFHFF